MTERIQEIIRHYELTKQNIMRIGLIMHRLKRSPEYAEKIYWEPGGFENVFEGLAAKLKKPLNRVNTRCMPQINSERL